MNNLSKKEYIKMYLMGEALKGAYSNESFMHVNPITRPDSLANSIAATVDRLLKNFNE